MNELSKVLIRARQGKSLSVLAASKAIGISATHLKDIELGTRSPSQAMLAKINDFYKLNLDNVVQYDRVATLDALRALMDKDRGFIPALQNLAGSNISASQLDQFIAINRVP